MIGMLAAAFRRGVFAIGVLAIFVLFVGPVAILVLTSVRPASGAYYIWRGTAFTLHNFVEVMQQSQVVRAMFNSFVLSSLATIFSLGITIGSGYMLSRFSGWIQRS